MPRVVTIAAAQSGPVSRRETRTDVVERLLVQMRQARAMSCDLIVYTECALTAFFPHWWIEDEKELESWFELEMPSHTTQPLFDEARRLKIGFHLGYAELAVVEGRKKRFNSCILVSSKGRIIAKHRKIHLPGHADHRSNNPFQNLEKRYFDVGDLAFRTHRAFGGIIGMCICNDRRWSETYRILGLGGVKLILIGYNTPDHIPEHPQLDRHAGFQHQLCMQAGAHQNGSWLVAVAKAGIEEGVSQIGLTSIIAPSGAIVAQSSTLADEMIVYRCDLDETRPYKELFDFERNRRIECYGAITNQSGVMLPLEESGTHPS
jgi:predicted amidohydrolase